MNQINQDVPFHFLSRKWVKILKLALDKMIESGRDPEKFYVYPSFQNDDDDEYPTYRILFYPHEIDWMNEGGDDVEDYIVVINATNLQFVKIYQGRN